MTDEKSTREKWLRAYDDMMVRVKTAIEEAEESTLPAIKRHIDKARDTAVELEELTRDEAERIAYFLERDLEDAGKHMAESGHELGDWLRFDIGLIEDRLLEVLLKVRRPYPPRHAAVRARPQGRSALQRRRGHRTRHAGMRVLRRRHPFPCHRLHPRVPGLRTHGIPPQVRHRRAVNRALSRHGLSKSGDAAYSKAIKITLLLVYNILLIYLWRSSVPNDQ